MQLFGMVELEAFVHPNAGHFGDHAERQIQFVLGFGERFGVPAIFLFCCHVAEQ